MNIRQLLERRAALTGEMRTLHSQHPDGALPDAAQARWEELTAGLASVDAATQRQALLDDVDRHSTDVREVETRGDVETAFALRPEQRMVDFIASQSGGKVEPLSIGRAIRGLVCQRWDGAEAERRVMSEGMSATGGFLIPPVLSGTVIDLARNRSVVIAAGAQTIPMTGPSMTFVQVMSDPTARWRGENMTIVESDGSFGTVSMFANSLAAMVRVSNELLADAPNFPSILDTQLSAALALEMDRAALFGTGAGMPLGLKNCSGVNQISMGANGATMDDYDDVLDLLQLVEESNQSVTTAVMSPRTRTRLEKLTTGISGDKTKLVPPPAYTALRRLTSNQIANDETQGSSSAASTLFLGGFENMAIGIRQSITIELSREADTAFAKNQTLVRAIMRGDTVFFRPAAFGRLVGIL